MGAELPELEPAIFSGSDAIPEGVWATLTSVTLPTSMLGGCYVSLREPRMVDVFDEGQYLKFGEAGPFVGIYLDPRSGRVVEALEAPGQSPRLIGVVNATLEQFASTTRSVMDMFPFYQGKSDLEERTEIAAGISKVIGRIDPAALTPDTFWATFVDDVINGDFSVDDVLNGGQENIRGSWTSGRQSRIAFEGGHAE